MNPQEKRQKAQELRASAARIGQSAEFAESNMQRRAELEQASRLKMEANKLEQEADAEDGVKQSA